MITKQSLKMGIFVSVLVVIGAALGIITADYQYAPQEPRPPNIQGLLWPEPKTLTPFTVIDNKNNAFTLPGLTGKWSFLFFGYTHCPDVCPITLSVMNKVYEQFDKSANGIRLKNLINTSPILIRILLGLAGRLSR